MLNAADMAAGEIWVEDSARAWHRVVAPAEPKRRRVACGVVLDLAFSRIWSVKPGEPGPPDDRRCDTCVVREAAESADQLEGSDFRPGAMEPGPSQA